MTPHEFIAKWQKANLSERSACQQHFLDLCDLLGQPKPAAADPEGAWYTFEKGVQKTGGGDGWADVWMRGHFGWEYKGKRKNLDEAYKQLLLYREALENPPLLVVCDLDRFEVHTNFTGTAKRKYEFSLADLAQPRNLDVLRKLFDDPDALRPDVTSEKITADAARRFADLAERLRMRPDVPAERAAHFLMKLMFCMFGEDIGLLPKKLFAGLLEKSKQNPASLTRRLETLFAAMAKGGDFGSDEILRFNGGLFEDADVIPLAAEEINILAAVNDYDWAAVEPSIFGTLFEGALDPSKRSQIGAHYTGRADIETLVQPVVMAPLRREWEEVKRQCEEKLWPAVVKASATRAKGRRVQLATPQTAARVKFDRAIQDFLERLAHVTVFDPACGSGNFLYVSLHLLLDLEKEVISYAAARGLTLVPHVHPRQLSGLEINPYAQQLASVVLWIGYLQWMHHNGFKMPRDPVLDPIETIHCQDAILDLSDPEHPKEPEWPEAEFIVGNPPFLGGNRIRQGLGNAYVEPLFHVYQDRVPGFADLCCYWFEKARDLLARGRVSRVGLLATQGIRGGANREVLKRIKESGEIFFAVSDRDWILDGANVHVSLIGFDAKAEQTRTLDGVSVQTIQPDLTSGPNVTEAQGLQAMQALHLEGVKKGAHFELAPSDAIEMLRTPTPHGRPNSDVIRPYFNGADLLGGEPTGWIVYFPANLPIEDAAAYEGPFQYVKKHVFPKYGKTRVRWWIHERARPEMAGMIGGLVRYLATVKHSKHRLFVWQSPETLVSNAIEFFARSDDYFFGILQSRLHEVWARRQATQLRERESGLRYTPTTCFETFPFPFLLGGAADGVELRPTGAAQRRTEFHSVQSDPPNVQDGVQLRPTVADGVQLRPTGEDAACEAIAAAARELDELRTRWLNPPEWTKTEVLEFPGSLDGPWARYIDRRTEFHSVPSDARGKVDGVKLHPTKEDGVELRPTKGDGVKLHPTKEDGVELRPPTRAAIGIVRWPRIVPKDADCAASLTKRTLTELYNQRPEWLALAHRKLDAAVFAAYGWEPGIPDETLLEKLLTLNLERAKQASM